MTDPHLHRQPEPVFLFDARGIAKRLRRAAIFGALDALQPGETLRFGNDQDPVPLLDQLMQRYGNHLTIRYHQREPGLILLDFTRTSVSEQMDAGVPGFESSWAAG